MEREVLKARIQRGCRKKHLSHLRSSCSHLEPLVPAEEGKCRMCAQAPWHGHASPREATSLFSCLWYISAHVIAWEKMWWLITVQPFLLGLGPSPKAGLEEEVANRSLQHRTKSTSLSGPWLFGRKDHITPGFHPSIFPRI